MSFFEWGKADENYGIDIDQQKYGESYQPVTSEAEAKYGDYEVLRRPTMGGPGGAGVIVPKDIDAGIPSIDDYIIYPDGTKQLKAFIADDQLGSLDTMTESVNNGRLQDVNVVKDEVLPSEGDIVIKKDNQDTAIKGILEQNAVNDIFFSDMNIKGLQDSIRYGVHQETGKVVSEQSQNELYVVMRSIMLQFANFQTASENVIEEIKRLNRKVLIYCIENISSNVKQHAGYVADLSKLPVPMDMPVYHNKKNYTYDISNLL
tara:strand:- start:1891 stop:2673 length:783 start_codon:yes stop_codon:yes gene_type:complete